LYGGIDLSPGSSGVVYLNADGTVDSYHHVSVADTKLSFTARKRMADEVIELLDRRPILLGLEDFALGPGQNVSYQIAEVAGIVKSFLLEVGYPLILIHPRKRQSFVLRKRKVTKNDVIAWAAKNGFSPPVKVRGGPGYKKREREDLADAFSMARIARELAMHMSEQSLPQSGNIFLDPDTGLMFNENVRFNCEKVAACLS
jgi:hypothetical protein